MCALWTNLKMSEPHNGWSFLDAVKKGKIDTIKYHLRHRVGNLYSA